MPALEKYGQPAAQTDRIARSKVDVLELFLAVGQEDSGMQ